MKVQVRSVAGLFAAVAGWLAGAPPVGAQPAGTPDCTPEHARPQFVIWNFSETTKGLIAPDTIKREVEDLLREFPASSADENTVMPLAKLDRGQPATGGSVERPGNRLAGSLWPASGTECNSREERLRISRAYDMTGLIQRGVVMAIVGDQEGITHYVLPYKAGPEGKLTFRNCFADPSVTLSAYLTRLKAHQMAAIGLYEAGRVHPDRDWCRLGAANVLLGRAVALLEADPSRSSEDLAFLTEVRRRKQRLEEELHRQVGNVPPGSDQGSGACGIPRQAAQLVNGAKSLRRDP